MPDGLYDLISVAAPSAAAALEAWTKKKGRRQKDGQPDLKDGQMLCFLQALTFEEVKKLNASIGALVQQLGAQNARFGDPSGQTVHK